MIGYSSSQKAWKLWDPTCKQLVVSRDVIFDESISAEQQRRTEVDIKEIERLLGVNNHPVLAPSVPIASSKSFDLLEAVGEDTADTLEAVGAEAEPEIEQRNTAETVGADPDYNERNGNRIYRARRNDYWTYEPIDQQPVQSPIDPNAVRTKSGRVVNLPARFAAIASSGPQQYENELDDFLGQPGIPDTHPSDVRLKDWSSDFSPAALATQASELYEPKSWKEAMCSNDVAQWTSAADEEIQSLEKARVFELVPRSAGRGRVVTAKWGLEDQKKGRWLNRPVQSSASRSRLISSRGH